jgi:hypothetical protein
MTTQYPPARAERSLQSERLARMAECRLRVAKGCGGHHEQGPFWRGAYFFLWVDCESCPAAAARERAP